MKVSINYAFLCDQAFLSADGKLNVTGIFEEINTRSFPALHPQLFVVCQFSVDEKGSWPYVIKITQKDKGQVFSSPDNIMLTSTKPNEALGNIFQITQIKFDEEGEYEVEIYINNKLEKSLPLRLKKI